jgi:hypothetical protein
MQRAVTVEVTCIDKDYGFTMLNIRDNFSGEKIGMISLSHEVIYGLDNITSDTHIVHLGINKGNIKTKENRL